MRRILFAALLASVSSHALADESLADRLQGLTEAKTFQDYIRRDRSATADNLLARAGTNLPNSNLTRNQQIAWSIYHGYVRFPGLLESIDRDPSKALGLKGIQLYYYQYVSNPDAFLRK